MVAVADDGEAVEGKSRPTSEFMSATNVLANGESDINELVKSGKLKNTPTDEEIDRTIDDLQRQGASQEDIQEILNEFGPGQLTKMNKRMLRAAKVLDEAYSKLANCYREQKCGQGSEFKRMCNTTKAQHASIRRINQAASRIEGINFNASGAPPLLGGGALDLNFEAVKSENVAYLSQTVCR